MVIYYLCFGTAFLSFHCAQVVFSCVSLSHHLDSFYQAVFLSSHTDYHTPLHPTTCNNPIGWHHTTETLHLPHACLYKRNTVTRGFPVDSWTLRMGPICCLETLVRNYHYLLCNNSEEHSSQQLSSGSLKLAYRAIFRESSYRLM